MSALMELLIGATQEAYELLADGRDPKAVYADLMATYAEFDLDANVAESSVDWLEGGTLVDDLQEALDKVSAAW